MTIKDWQTLLSKIEVQWEIKPVRAAAIKEFEQSLVLPKSYKDYCKVFGAGFLGSPCSYAIAVPGAESERFSLGFRCKWQIESSDVEDVHPGQCDFEQIERAWFFASENRNNFFWDPNEITHKRDKEYAIYMITEDYKSYRIADTFWAFVNDICLGSGPPTYKKYKNKWEFSANS